MKKPQHKTSKSQTNTNTNNNNLVAPEFTTLKIDQIREYM
jgi:hypothetical protein